MIELHVSENDTFEDGVEAAIPGDMRIVAFADSQAGGEDSDEERRKRKKKRRAVKSKKYALFSFHYNVNIVGNCSSQVIFNSKGWFETVGVPWWGSEMQFGVKQIDKDQISTVKR